MIDEIEFKNENNICIMYEMQMRSEKPENNEINDQQFIQ